MAKTPWNKYTKKELIEAIEALEKIARDNMNLAERATTQAKEWQKEYNQLLFQLSCTESNTSNQSLQVH